MITSPLRAAWAARTPEEGDAPSLHDFLPALLSMTLTTTAIAFFAFNVWGFLSAEYLGRLQLDLFLRSVAPDAIRSVTGLVQAHVFANVLITNLILLAPVLTLLRRWRLPFGSCAILFTFPTLWMSGLAEFRFPEAILAAATAGLVADVLCEKIDPVATRLGAFRAFATAIPVALWSIYFLMTALLWGIAASPAMWGGRHLLHRDEWTRAEPGDGSLPHRTRIERPVLGCGPAKQGSGPPLPLWCIISSRRWLSNPNINNRRHAHPGHPMDPVSDWVAAVDRDQGFDAEDGVKVRLQLSDCLDLREGSFGPGDLRGADVAGLAHSDAQDRNHFRLLEDFDALIGEHAIDEIIERRGILLDHVADAKDLDQPRDVLRPRVWREQKDERHRQDCQDALCRAHLLASVAQPIIENAILSIQTYPRFGVVHP